MFAISQSSKEQLIETAQQTKIIEKPSHTHTQTHNQQTKRTPSQGNKRARTRTRTRNARTTRKFIALASAGVARCFLLSWYWPISPKHGQYITPGRGDSIQKKSFSIRALPTEDLIENYGVCRTKDSSIGLNWMRIKRIIITILIDSEYE